MSITKKDILNNQGCYQFESTEELYDFLINIGVPENKKYTKENMLKYKYLYYSSNEINATNYFNSIVQLIDNLNMISDYKPNRINYELNEGWDFE